MRSHDVASVDAGTWDSRRVPRIIADPRAESIAVYAAVGQTWMGGHGAFGSDRRSGPRSPGTLTVALEKCSAGNITPLLAAGLRAAGSGVEARSPGLPRTKSLPPLGAGGMGRCTLRTILGSAVTSPSQFCRTPSPPIPHASNVSHARPARLPPSTEWAHVWTVKNGQLAGFLEYADTAAASNALRNPLVLNSERRRKNSPPPNKSLERTARQLASHQSGDVSLRRLGCVRAAAQFRRWADRSTSDDVTRAAGDIRKHLQHSLVERQQWAGGARGQLDEERVVHGHP